METRTRREIIAIRAPFIAAIARKEIEWTYQQKMRLAYGIPYHEWQEALVRGALAKDMLIQVYTPGFGRIERADGLRPRCPPWAGRRYRECCVLNDFFPPEGSFNSIASRSTGRVRHHSEGGLSAMIKRASEGGLAGTIERMRGGGLSARIAAWPKFGLRGRLAARQGHGA